MRALPPPRALGSPPARPGGRGATPLGFQPVARNDTSSSPGNRTKKKKEADRAKSSVVHSGQMMLGATRVVFQVQFGSKQSRPNHTSPVVAWDEVQDARLLAFKSSGYLDPEEKGTN